MGLLEGNQPLLRLLLHGTDACISCVYIYIDHYISMCVYIYISLSLSLSPSLSMCIYLLIYFDLNYLYNCKMILLFYPCATSPGALRVVRCQSGIFRVCGAHVHLPRATPGRGVQPWKILQRWTCSHCWARYLVMANSVWKSARLKCQPLTTQKTSPAMCVVRTAAALGW